MTTKTTTTPLAAAADYLRSGFDLFGRALRGIVHPTDENGRERGEQPAAVASDLGAFTVESVTTVRRILAGHLDGDLTESGCLAVALLCDADVVGALGQRLLALQACPTRIHPADESPAAVAEAADLEARWPRMVPRSAQGDVVGGAIFLGAALGQLVYYPDPDGVLEPRLEAWPWHAAEYRRYERRWYVHTVDGTYPITPGDGQWVLFTPRSDMQPLAWGVLRCIAVPSLRGDYGDADLSRHGEVHGSPAWVVTVPLESRKSDDARGLVRGLRNLGRNAVIPVPRGKNDGESYDVRLEQAKAEAAKVFEAIRQSSSAKIRLGILGQNLTSANNKVGTNASSESGEGVTDLVVTADGLGWGECMTAQVAAIWARRRGKPACRIEVDTERESDAKKDAEASAAEAKAILAWEEAGVEVDAVAHATKAGMIGAKKRVQVKPPPRDPSAPPAPPAPPAGGSSRAQHRHPHAPRAASDQPTVDDPNFPYLSFERKGNDGCDICGPLEGVLLTKNHPFWDTHTPPMHGHCVCNLLPQPASAADQQTPEDELHALPQAAPGWGTGDAPPNDDP